MLEDGGGVGIHVVDPLLVGVGVLELDCLVVVERRERLEEVVVAHPGVHLRAAERGADRA